MPYEWLTEAFRDVAAHGIEPHEVTQVLSARRRLPRPLRHPEGLALLTIWGRTAAGRPLAVYLRRAGQFDWLILGARELRDRERTELEKWESTD